MLLQYLVTTEVVPLERDLVEICRLTGTFSDIYRFLVLETIKFRPKIQEKMYHQPAPHLRYNDRTEYRVHEFTLRGTNGFYM